MKSIITGEKIDRSIIAAVTEQMVTLPCNLQKQVLKFVKELKLSSRGGVSGKSLLKYVGTISLNDLKIMYEVIEADCRQIDINEW